MKERVPRQMGSIAESKGPCLEPISALIEAERVVASTKQRKRDCDETFEDGTWWNEVTLPTQRGSNQKLKCPCLLRRVRPFIAATPPFLVYTLNQTSICSDTGYMKASDPI